MSTSDCCGVVGAGDIGIVGSGMIGSRVQPVAEITTAVNMIKIILFRYIVMLKIKLPVSLYPYNRDLSNII